MSNRPPDRLAAWSAGPLAPVSGGAVGSVKALIRHPDRAGARTARGYYRRGPFTAYREG